MLLVPMAQPAWADQPSGDITEPPAMDAVAVALGDQDVRFTDAAGNSVRMLMPAHRVLGHERGTRYGAGSYSFEVLPGETGAAVLIDITDRTAPERYLFEFDLPRGWDLKKDPASGAVLILDGSGEPAGAIAPPWAVDAAGRAVSTTFSVRGHSSLVQTVEHEGATYPVVADPSITLGLNVYLWVRGYEIYWWGSVPAAVLAASICVTMGALHPVLCLVGAGGAAALQIAFRQVFSSDNCRYVIAFRYWGWPNYMERLNGYGCSYFKYDIPG